jgi:hypothetical protein
LEELFCSEFELLSLSPFFVPFLMSGPERPSEMKLKIRDCKSDERSSESAAESGKAGDSLAVLSGRGMLVGWCEGRKGGA